MRLSRRKLTIIFGILFVVLIGDVLLFFANVRQVVQNQDNISRIQNTVTELDAVAVNITKTQDDLLDYDLTKNKDNITSYNDDQSALQTHLARLINLTNNAKQQAQVQNLQSQINNQVKQTGNLLFLLEENRQNDETNKSAINGIDQQSKNTFDLMSQLRATQQAELIARTHDYENSIRVTLISFAITSLVNFFLMIGFFTLFEHDISQHIQLRHKEEEYLTIASHELKTPLTTIKGYAQLLQKDARIARDPQVEKYLQKINLHINKLIFLVSALLDVSKIKSGKMLLNISRFSLYELVQDVIDDVQLMSSQHHIILSGSANLFVTADKTRIAQVITNLLTNATKYSPTATQVEISIQKNGNQVEVAVRDYGIGIDQAEQRKVFGKFYRTKDALQGYFGMGIGLYICQEIISRHKGKIWVKSEKGKGSTFAFALPLSAPHA